MAKTKEKGKAEAPKEVPFGGYAVNFKGCTDTLESLFGSAPMPPSGMTKRLWDYVRRHRSRRRGSAARRSGRRAARSPAAARHLAVPPESSDLLRVEPSGQRRLPF
jgi:hypothetical protein